MVSMFNGCNSAKAPETKLMKLILNNLSSSSNINFKIYFININIIIYDYNNQYVNIYWTNK